MDQARVVVVGGGITGCSVAYHLAEAGWTDVVLVEKGALTSGSTSHAAGLVTVFNPSSTMHRLRRYSVELYGRLGVFSAVGSLRIASSAAQLAELQRTVSRVRAIGLEAQVVGPVEARRLMPAISEDALFGGVFLPQDGFLDPHAATTALADAARRLGVTIRTNARVTGIELDADRAPRRIRLGDEAIDTEHLVIAAGMWAPRLAAMAGAHLASTPVDHQHAALLAVAGHELPDGMPCFRDPDNLIYGKSEHGGMVLGGYEPDPVARWIDGVPWEHGERSLAPDWARFEPLLAGAIRRFPFLADARAVRLECHPDAMTPDANPLLGPIPGLRNVWAAAGLSLNGFGGAGGLGRALAGWMTTGDPGLDVHAYRPGRFGSPYRDPGFVAEQAREAYRYYYLQRFPDDADEAGRPRRLSALHGRLQEAGAVFMAKHGWERADRFEPATGWRRAGPDGRAWRFERPPFFDLVGAEQRAVRERAGLVDLSSFGKIDVTGPGACRLLERVAANAVDRPVGSVVYTPWLDELGGMVADVTITRLAADRFRVITGAGYVAGDLGWLRMHQDPADGDVRLRDVSEEVAVLGLWGPRARDILARASAHDVADAAIPLRTMRFIEVGAAPVLATRISYAGELGWELAMPPEWAVQVWDRLVEAGRSDGLAPFGYRALEALRLEKGYRYYGTDLTMLETPDEAGLGPFVRVAERSFVGRAALLERRAAGMTQRLRTIAVGDGEWVPIWGGEAVHEGAATLGRVRSAAFGTAVSRMLATVYLPLAIEEGAQLTVDVFGRLIPAVVAADVPFDPTGARMRG